MKTFGKFFFLPFLLLSLSFSACSSDDEKEDETEETSYRDYNLSQLNATFEDGIERSLIKFTYGENNQLSQAVYYYYNIGEDGDPTDVKLDETFTFDYTHNNNIINVKCASIDHTDDDKKREWIMTFTTNGGNIIKVENNSEEEIYDYTWNDGKLVNALQYDFTYNGVNLTTAIKVNLSEYDEYKYKNTDLFSLTYNTGKENPFKMIPMEFLVTIMDFENIEIFCSALAYNEISRIINTDETEIKDASDDSLLSTYIYTYTTDYNYIYDDNNMVITANSINSYNYKYTNHKYPESNNESNYDSESSTIHFVYSKK